jgi:replicative DNA helicase
MKHIDDLRTIRWPSDLNAEITLVGAIVAQPELLSKVSGIVENDHFVDPACRMIWTAVVGLGKKHGPLTIDEIVAQIEATGGFSNVDCGDVKSVRECVEVTLADFDRFPKEAEWAAWRIRVNAHLRELVAESDALKEAAIGGTVSEITSIVAKLAKVSNELEQASSASDVALEALQDRST